jgi:DNA-binding LacI/PurR family transcriptional regulator
MMASPLAAPHALLWGSGTTAGTKEEQAWELCRRYRERQVAGVFFAPVEFVPERDDVNRRIARALDDAGIPVVLLDRTIGPRGERGRHDLVALDHRQAGYLITEHLVTAGAERVAFVGMPGAAATVDARAAGYREALHVLGRSPGAGEHRIDPGDAAAVRTLMRAARPDGIACANDRTAARLMQALMGFGCAVPGDVRLVGIDDADYAAVLPVPLTTLQQPTRSLGAAAMSAMLDRVAGAALPARDILLQGRLIVRRSCGTTGG